jgi:hypothetical protein
VRYPNNTRVPTTDGVDYTTTDNEYIMEATPDFQNLTWVGKAPFCNTDSNSCKTDINAGWNFAGMYDGSEGMGIGINTKNGTDDCRCAGCAYGNRHTLCYWKAAGGQMNTCPGVTELSDNSAPLANVPPQNTMGPLKNTKFKGKYLPVNENDASLTAKNRANTNALWVFNLPLRWQVWEGERLGPVSTASSLYYSATYDLDYISLTSPTPQLKRLKAPVLKGAPPPLPPPATQGTGGGLLYCFFYGDYVAADDKPETIARTDVLWIFNQIDFTLTDPNDFPVPLTRCDAAAFICPNTVRIGPLPNYYSKYYYGMFDPKSGVEYDAVCRSVNEDFFILHRDLINNPDSWLNRLTPKLMAKPLFGVTVSWTEVPGTAKFTLGYTSDPVYKLVNGGDQYIAGFRGVISAPNQNVVQMSKPRANGIPNWPVITGFKSMNESFWAPISPPPRNSTRWTLRGLSNPHQGNNRYGFDASAYGDNVDSQESTFLVSTTLIGQQPIETFVPPKPLYGIQVSWTPVDKWAEFTRGYFDGAKDGLNSRGVISAANQVLPTFKWGVVQYPADKKPAFWAPVLTDSTNQNDPEWMEEGITFVAPNTQNATPYDITTDNTSLVGTVLVNLKKVITVSDHTDADFTADFARGIVKCMYPKNLIDSPTKLANLTSLITSPVVYKNKDGAVTATLPSQIHPEMGDKLAAEYCTQEVKTCVNSAYTPGVPMVACSRFRSSGEDGNACRAWAAARPAAADKAYEDYCLKYSANQDCDCLSRQEVAGVDKKLRQSYVDTAQPVIPGTAMEVADRCWYMPCKNKGAYSLVTTEIAEAKCPEKICKQVVGGWAGRDVNLNNVDVTMDCRDEYKAELDGKYTCSGNSCVAATAPKDAFPSLAACSAACGNVRPTPPGPGPSPSGPGLSGGAIAGISVGCIVFVIIIIVIAVTTKKKIAAP